jgi:hypothetical protein
MRRYSEPYDLSSAMPHDQQTIEQTERDCRHDEQIDRGDAVGMIAEERLPPLGRRTSPLGHIFGYARLSDRDVELEQLSMDPWRSPQWVGDAHLADQSAYFQRYCRPTTTRSRLPAPVQTEARTVPFDYGPGPNNRKRIKNAREEAIETNEHQSVDGTEGLFLGGGSSQNNDLLPQR